MRTPESPIRLAEARFEFRGSYTSFMGLRCYQWELMEGSTIVKDEMKGPTRIHAGTWIACTVNNFWDGRNRFVRMNGDSRPKS